MTALSDLEPEPVISVPNKITGWYTARENCDRNGKTDWKIIEIWEDRVIKQMLEEVKGECLKEGYRETVKTTTKNSKSKIKEHTRMAIYTKLCVQ